MNKDDIITLDNKKKYLILYKTDVKNDKYLITSIVKNNLPTEEYKIFKIIMDGNDSFLEEEYDNDIITKIVDNFERLYE